MSGVLAFLLLAVIGFAGSIAVHVRSYVADDGIGQLAFIAMFAGVFVVFIPAIAAAPPPDDPQRKSGKAGEIWDVLPRPLQVLLPAFGGYVVVNFIMCMILMGTSGQVLESDGVVYEKGDPRVRVDPVEGRRRLDLQEVRVSRMFSGHAMAFYGASATMLWAGRRRSMRRELEHRIGGAFGPERVPGAWRRPTPQMHASVGIFLWMAGFFGGISVGTILVVFVHPIPILGRILVPVVFVGGTILGLFGLPKLWALLVSARCPRCGGRSSRGGNTLDGRAQYACHDCGHVEPLGFRGGVGGASAD